MIITNYPDYDITEEGIITNIKRKTQLKHYARDKKHKQQYLRVCLKGKNQYVHRLLAQQFIPNPDNKEFVDHINTNRQDNRLENLRWASRGENIINRKLQSKFDKTYIGEWKKKNSKYDFWTIIIGHKDIQYKFIKTTWSFEEVVRTRDIIMSNHNIICPESQNLG